MASSWGLQQHWTCARQQGGSSKTSINNRELKTWNKLLTRLGVIIRDVRIQSFHMNVKYVDGMHGFYTICYFMCFMHFFPISFKHCARVCTMPCRLLTSLEREVSSSIHLSSFSEFSFFISNNSKVGGFCKFLMYWKASLNNAWKDLSFDRIFPWSTILVK